MRLTIPSWDRWMLMNAPALWRLRPIQGVIIAIMLTLLAFACGHAVPKGMPEIWTYSQTLGAYTLLGSIVLVSIAAWASSQLLFPPGALAGRQMLLLGMANFSLLTIMLSSMTLFDHIVATHMRLAMQPELAKSEIAWWSGWRNNCPEPLEFEEHEDRNISAQPHLAPFGLTIHIDARLDCLRNPDLDLFSADVIGTRTSRRLSPEQHLQAIVVFGPGHQHMLLTASVLLGGLLTAVLHRAANAGFRLVSPLILLWRANLERFNRALSFTDRVSSASGRKLLSDPTAWTMKPGLFLIASGIIAGAWVLLSLLGGSRSSFAMQLACLFAAILLPVVIGLARSASGFRVQLVELRDVHRMGAMAVAGTWVATLSMTVCEQVVQWTKGNGFSFLAGEELRIFLIATVSLSAYSYVLLLITPLHWVVGATFYGLGTLFWAGTIYDRSYVPIWGGVLSALGWSIASVLAHRAWHFESPKIPRALALPLIGFASWAIALLASAWFRIIDTPDAVRVAAFLPLVGVTVFTFICMMTTLPWIVMHLKNDPVP